MHQKIFEMNSFKKILVKIENVEKIHKKYVNFSILVKKRNSRYLIKIKYLTMAESNPFIAEVPKS